MAEMRPDEPRIPDVEAGRRRWGPSRWVPLAALAIIPLAAAANFAKPAESTPPMGGRMTVADGEPGRHALDPTMRSKLVVAFGEGLWVPMEADGPVRLTDEQMRVVGTGDTMRVYAPMGGGGGGPDDGWQAGEVFIKVGEGLYWPLAPRGRTPPPAQQRPDSQRPDHRPLREPAPAPAPKAGDR